MSHKLYTIGLDFGSLSCRGILAGTDGSIAAEADLAYPHGIMERALPDGTELNTPFIGSYEGRAIYLLFNGILRDRNPRNGNVLHRFGILSNLWLHFRI